MKYPNALSGIRTIRTARILYVWLLGIAALVLLLGASASESALSFLLILSLIAIVMSITALIMELVGVNRAAKDHSLFGTARTALIIGLVASILSAFFEDDSAPDTILGLVNTVCSLVASIYILKGIIALAETYRRVDMVEEGQRLIKLILGIAILDLVIEILGAVLPVNTGTAILLIIIAVVSLLLSLVQLILFLSYLKKAIGMLETRDPTYDGTGGASGSSWGYGL